MPHLNFYSSSATVPKGLGKNIRELPVGLDVLEDDMSSVVTLTNEVKTSANMLTAIVKDGILCQCNGRLVVHLEYQCSKFFFGDLL